MRAHVLAVLASVSVLMTGCASGPAYHEAMSKAKPVAADAGRIYIYRPSSLGAAVQPKIHLNEEIIGASKAHGFVYVDRAAGDYRVTTSTELEKSATFHLSAGETKYVRLKMTMGLLVGHLNPEIVDTAEGQEELEKMKYTGDK